MNLQFGLACAVPATVTTAWGARWIYPDDMLWDRQSVSGPDFETALQPWLDAGPIGKARNQARLCAGVHFQQDSCELVILYRDGKGVIVANPNRSFGYLYVAAWLHDNDPAKQPPSGTLDLTHKYNNKPRRAKQRGRFA